MGLLALPRESWEAIEADLLDKGFTLADVPGRVTWRALIAMIKHSPRSSALTREMFAEEVSWSVTDHLLAGILDYSALIAWLNSDTKKNKRPDPIKRPGVEPKSDDKRLGKPVPASKFWDLWNNPDPDLIDAILEGGDQDAG